MKRITKVALAATFALAPLAAGAITLLPPCTTTGNCGIGDILAVLINIAEFLLAIVGAVALGYFVYGGFVFVLSRGNKGEVDRAMGILRSAAIGVFIVFLSGVLVRFTTEALTGGQSTIPTVGETCDPGGQKSAPAGKGLWVLLPGGTGPNGFKPEGLVCVLKDTGAGAGKECKNLNDALKERGRTGGYTCLDTGSVKKGSCVRGLCGGTAEFACCITSN